MTWDINTYWFDVSLITGITAFGSIYFGHFEIHTAKWRRVLKLLLLICSAVAITSTAGRLWTYVFIFFLLILVVIVHGIILPSKGINGLTGEPKEKYHKLRGWDKHF
jgi:hypothetical protein